MRYAGGKKISVANRAMAHRFGEGDLPIGGLYLPIRWSRLGLANRLTSWAGSRFLELLSMLAGQLLIDGSAQLSSDFMAELFDFGERRILRRTVRSVTHGGHRSHALVQLFLDPRRPKKHPF